MFECAMRGTICDGTCVECPREKFKPKTKEEYEEELISFTSNLGLDIPSHFLSLAAAELANGHGRVYEDFMRTLGLPDTASYGSLTHRTSFPANRKEALCTNCGPVDCAAHVGLCATCAAFIDFDPDVVTEP
jgi:hypothetical protein